jgi:hypothetical protein
VSLGMSLQTPAVVGGEEWQQCFYVEAEASFLLRRPEALASHSRSIPHASEWCQLLSSLQPCQRASPEHFVN